MLEPVFKPRDSELRAILKIFKIQFDDHERLRRLEPALRRLIFLETSPQNSHWRGEGLDRLALFYESQGNTQRAQEHYQMALERLRVGDYLGRAKVMRHYGLMLAQTHSPESGMAMIEEALQLHNLDLARYADDESAVAKGRRERRLTECYLWCAMTMIDPSDEELIGSIASFALKDAREFSHQDQQRLLAFALKYNKLSTTHALLSARLVQISARRRKLRDAAKSAIVSMLKLKVMIAKKVIQPLN